jgi:protein kinase
MPLSIDNNTRTVSPSVRIVWYREIAEAFYFGLKRSSLYSCNSVKFRSRRVAMNRYNVLEPLGDGAFGVVFRAEQKNTGEICAIKRMKQRFVTWEECLQLREIISLRRLQHANVIKLKEVIRENAELCMVFEFMEQNIYQIMKQRSVARGHSPNLFDEKEIRSILAQTLLGLQAIHKGGFMHRDLKPENLLTKGDLVKIADFGLAKEIRSRPPFTDYVSTRWYRAPEIVLRSDRYNSPIDIWALGAIAVELYLNRPLFPGASDPDQLFKICSVLGAPTPAEWEEGHHLIKKLNLRFPQVSPTPLRQLLANTHASPAALDLLEQMLRFNPGDRPTASQCLMHPFITGGNEGALGGGTANLYQGISSGQSHNPFHVAAGVPGGVVSGFPPNAGAQTTYPGRDGGSSGNTFQPPYRSSPSPPGGSPTPGAAQPQPRPYGQGAGVYPYQAQGAGAPGPGSPFTGGAAPAVVHPYSSTQFGGGSGFRPSYPQPYGGAPPRNSDVPGHMRTQSNGPHHFGSAGPLDEY